MAELNLKQVINKLNNEFSSDIRKLVFWYDANSEFSADIDSLVLDNAKVYKLEQDNQFRTKYLLEREDTETNYLIYASFAKPALRDNHLADILRYSKEFFADRTSLLALDLGIEEKYKPVIQHYIKFFGAKERTQKFYDLEIENFNKSVIEMALMSILCKTKIVSFEEVIRAIITEDDLEDNKLLLEFEKYNLLTPFWQMCEDYFGYVDVAPTLSKLVYSLLVTYTSKVVQCDLPRQWMNYSSHKSGNIIAFIDGLMNSLIYRESFDALSEKGFIELDGDVTFAKFKAEDLVECELFKQIDRFIIDWLIARLENEDTDAKLSSYSIPEICEKRRKLHFGSLYSSQYFILENAYYLIMAARYSTEKSGVDIVKKYIQSDYVIDQHYRYFYYHYDKVFDNIKYEMMRDLVENIYTNRYLEKLLVAWNTSFSEAKCDAGIVKQQEFYKQFVRTIKEKVVVIISDALRFEVGQTLVERLKNDEKCTASITAMQSVLPSYTRFGMSALLPHKELAMNSEYKVLVDGKLCDDLRSREAILQSYNPNSRTVQFDDIKTMKIAELKEIFAGQEVVYVYHNQIDARGDKLNTENEVFNACEEAVDEIHTMIKRLTTANNSRFIVTADHGFIYKRDKLVESDKISGFEKNNTLFGRRYVIADQKVEAEGICAVSLGEIMGNDDTRIVSLPIGSDVFKVSGGGQNFVHGGSSLQEMIIPVIDVKTDKTYKETKSVSIALVSLIHKITNLSTNLDFIQTEQVTDVTKETTYKVYFVTDNNEKVSSESIYVADKKDMDSSKRIFRLKFTFKNKQYDRNRKYYLVAYDQKNNLEVIRHEVHMDLAFVDDFGFSV